MGTKTHTTMLPRLLLAAAVLLTVAAAPAAPPGRTAPKPFAPNMLCYGVVDAGQLDLPAVVLPWWVLLQHDVANNEIRKIQADCNRDLRLLFKVPRPIERMRQIQTLDLKYRPKLFALTPEKLKALLKKLLGDIDKLREMMRRYKAMLAEQAKRAGLTKPLLLYADRTIGRRANLTTQVLLFAGDRVLVREHILLTAILKDPAMKLTREQLVTLRKLDAERRTLLARATKSSPPVPRKGKPILLRRWNVALIAKTEKLVKANTELRLKVLTTEQQTIVRGLFKIADQAESGMAGMYKDICHEMDTIGGNAAH